MRALDWELSIDTTTFSNVCVDKSLEAHVNSHYKMIQNYLESPSVPFSNAPL